MTHFFEIIREIFLKTKESVLQICHLNYNILVFQHIGFHATSKSRWERREVTRLQMDPIEAGGTETFNRKGLHIPPVPASYLGGCNIIDIQYELTVNTHIHLCSHILFALRAIFLDELSRTMS